MVTNIRLTPTLLGFEQDCRILGKILGRIDSEVKELTRSDLDKISKLLNRVSYQTRNAYGLPIKLTSKRANNELDAKLTSLKERIGSFARKEIALLGSDERKTIVAQAGDALGTERSRRLLKGLSKIYVARLYRILDTWVEEPHGKEKRESAREKIVSWLKGKTSNLDFSHLGLTSIPPIFHLFSHLNHIKMDLTGNSLKTIPSSLFTFVDCELKIKIPSGEEFILTYRELGNLRVYCNYFLEDNSELPIEALVQVVKSPEDEVLESSDFISTPESTRLTGGVYQCLGQKGAHPEDVCFLFGESAHYRRCHAEERKAIRTAIFPALEPFAQDTAITIHRDRYAHLFHALGFRYYGRVLFPNGERGGGFLVLPSLECLKARWEQLRQSATNRKLPALSFFSSEGIASSAEFIDAFFERKIVVSNGRERYHDMVAHVIPTLVGIFSRAERDREVYVEERSRLEEVVRNAYEKIQYAIAHPDKAGSSEQERCIKKYQVLVMELLSAYIDTCTNLVDYTAESDFFNSPTLIGVVSHELWMAYLKKNFAGEWVFSEFCKALGAISGMQPGTQT